ncbi:MAG: hypothetical protein LH473_03040, partial [Chitinophagales bacterium]|nr:hypothetical protein [Chitinophagales bacterium]
MPDQLITCPYCHKPFPLSEAMTHDIEEKVKSNYQQQLTQMQEQHEQEIANAKTEAAKQALLKAKKDNQAEVDNLKNQVTELETKQIEFTKKELQFLKRERQIADREKQIEVDKQKFINSKTEELQTSIREVVEGELKGKLSEKDK